MSIVPFEYPDELKSISYQSILQKMLAAIPDNVDKTEGGFVYDMCAPAALEAAELIQFWLVLGLKNSFHQYASGRWLDYCAYDVGLERKAATYAYGNVTVTTSQNNLTFPTGFIFSVPSENGSAAIDFESIEAKVCDTKGTYKIRVKAVLSGPESNVKADTINIMKNPISGVADITNEEPLSGGTGPESDDDLRQRIDDYYAGRMASFVGNKKDYIRWAKEVDGVGYARCVPNYFKAWQSIFTVTDKDGNEVKGNLHITPGDRPNEIKIIDDSSSTANPHTLTGNLDYTGKNSVKVVVADLNGDPANEEILAAVEKHIFGTGHDDLNRLAPIGVAKYEIAPPIPEIIYYSFELKLENDYNLATVKQNITDNLKEFYQTLADEDLSYGTLRYVAVSDVLFHTKGVADFKHLRINGEIANVEFGEDHFPVTGELFISTYND